MRAWGVAAVAVLLAACQINPSTGPKRPGTNDPAVAPSPSPSAKSPASALPSAPALGLNSPAPQAQVVSLLAAPPNAARSLAGVLKLDPAYVVAAGGGNVVASGGGNVIAAGGGNVVAAGGGNVIAAGGGNVIAAGGGNVIAAGGGNIVAAGGGNVIAAGGGNVLAAGAGNLLASGGGNVIAAGGGNYRLAQADAGASGQALPAAGVVVGLIDLGTGQLVPVGVDHEGQPVLAIYTNATGAFTLHPPADAKGNLAIVARLPGAEKDPRLAYDRITPSKALAGQEANDLNEATALTTRFLLSSTEARMVDLLRRIHAADPNDPESLKSIAGSFNSKDQAKNGLIRCLIQEVKSRLGGQAPSDEAYLTVARRETRLMIAHFDMAQLRCRQHAGDMPQGQQEPDPEVVNRYFGQENVLPVMTEALNRTQVKVAIKAQAAGGLKALESVPELQATGVAFLKASDVCQAIVDRSYANEALIAAGGARKSFVSLGFTESEATELDNAMRSVASGLGVAIGGLMLDGLKSGDPSFLRAFLDNVGPSAQADALASFTGCLLGQQP